MTFSNIAQKVQKFTIDNSPLLLTVVGATGVVATAYLTGRASFKAADVLREYSEAGYVKRQELDLKKKVNLTWKLYIPAITVGTATLAAVVGANQIGTKRTAALAAAYTLSQTAVDEYRAKVVEKLGEKKATQIRDEVAQDRVDANPVSGRDIIMTGSNEVLCCELYTGRYFKSSRDAVEKARNDLNYRMLHDGYASLGDFYDLVGLPSTKMSDEVGWTNDKPMDIHFTATLTEDSLPCLAIDYHVQPVRDYFRFR